MASPQESKNNRRCLTLETKHNVLKCLSGGQTFAAVARTFNMNESTVRSIKKNESAIQAVILNSTDCNTKHSSYVHDPIIEKMEKALLIFIEEMAQKRCPLDQEIIMAKALKLYHMFKDTVPSTSASNKKHEFIASKG